IACASVAGAFRVAVFLATGRFDARLAGVFFAAFFAGIAYLPPAFGADVFLSAGFPPVCPRKSRVGENSPSLCPTMFSVTYTGMNLLPLWTAKVWPTKSGSTVLER